MIQDPPAATGTQASVLTAAENLFKRFGYAKVTMEEIASEAGLKKPSLYYYYPTKEELFRAVVEKSREAFREEIEQIVDSDRSAGSRVEQYVAMRFNYFRSLQELHILDFKQATRNAPALAQMFRDHAAEELEWLVILLEDGHQSGEFRSGSSRQIAEVFLHTLQGLRLRVMRESQYVRPDAAAMERLLKEMQLFTKIFLSGISARSSD